MNIDLSMLVYPMIVLVGAIGGYLFKKQDDKIANLESRMINAISETEVRQIIRDKTEPMKDTLNEIRDKIDKLFDLYLEDKHPPKS